LAAFEADRPRILGALLDAVASGLKRLPEIALRKIPRMADFAIWATACETAFWKEGTFMSAYTGNIDEAVETLLDNSPVATAVRTFMAMQMATTWTGTATDLLELLGRVAGEKATKAKNWPADATRLSGRLRRVAPFLRSIGIEINIERKGKERTRTITITLADGHGPEGRAAPANEAPASANGSGDNVNTDAAASLNDEIICKLADAYREAAEKQYKQTGAVNFASLDRQFCKSLAAAALVPPEFIEAVLARVKKMLSA
jgi:hypothetical protein